MRNFINSLKARRDSAKSQGGFSLIDVVVTVAIIVALSVGGFIAYTGIVDNAKGAALSSAADQIRTGGTVASNDSDPATTPASVAGLFASSSDGEYTVDVTGMTLPDKGSIEITQVKTGNTKTVNFG